MSGGLARRDAGVAEAQATGPATRVADRPPGSRRRFDVLLWAVVLGVGVVYVANRWTPSSYAIVMKALGESETGLVLGTPRVERGDEYGWHTPLVQMAVRSRFARYDSTPPFHEDLRTLYGLPVLDWGLVFKPNVWGFLLLPPAYAYSLYQYSLIALCILGFTFLFRAQGSSPPVALLGALALFFTAYAQYWWNGFSNFFLSAFPWVLLASLAAHRSASRAFVFYWVAVSAALVFLYPPVALSFAFVGVVFFVAFRPEDLRLRPLAIVGGVAAAAAGTVFLYLRDAIEALGRTTYPGHRLNGGGGVGLDRWLQQFVPTILADRHRSLVPDNVCEASAIGSFYLLAVLLFLDYRALLDPGRVPRRSLRALGVLAVALLAVWAWMLLPLPPWAGYPLGWHRVPPGRIVVAAGVLAFSLSLLAARTCGLRLTPARIAAFAAVVSLAFLHFKWIRHRIGLDHAWVDLLVVAPVLALAAWHRWRPLSPSTVNASLLAASAAVGAIAFGGFNPIQKADPIFAPHDTALTRAFEARLSESRSPYLLVPFGSGFFGHSGQNLIGLGYPSIGHATFRPKVEYFRRLFPDLPAGEFKRIFDNAGVFAVDDVDHPYRRTGTLVTIVPMRPFLAPAGSATGDAPPGPPR
jgi:hypothetical protein